MAQLRLPEKCCICQGTLRENDRVVMEREALLYPGSRRDRKPTLRPDGRWVREWTAVLFPQIVPKSPTNVRHKECNDGV